MGDGRGGDAAKKPRSSLDGDRPEKKRGLQLQLRYRPAIDPSSESERKTENENGKCSLG